MRRHLTDRSRPRPRVVIGLLGAAAALLGGLLVDVPGLEPQGARMLGIFLAAIILWVTEAVPLVATSMGVILAEVLLISSDAVVPVPGDAQPATVYFGALASPVIILFLGGFMIADGAGKFDVGRALSARLLRPLAGRPRLTVLGIMAITALLGMIMSNTATTATMFAVMIPVIQALPDPRARTGVALAIPVAASVGGMATPVGSPPNAIALGILQQAGIRLTFLDWVLLSLPLVLVLLAVAWAYICALHIPRSTVFDIDTSARFQTSRRAIAFYVVALGTITLWMTEPLHGMSAGTVGLLAVVALLSLKVMDGDDVRSLDWPVLWLVAGGIALGAGVGHTGLDRWIIDLVHWEAIPVLLVLLVLAGLAWTVSNFISSTAAANLLVPMGVGIAANVPHSAGEVALVLALACSLGMCLPISTPPNAIAHATGEVSTGAMVRIGLVVGVTGVLLLAFVAPWLWALEGVLP